jgi:hypothetical protein
VYTRIAIGVTGELDFSFQSMASFADKFYTALYVYEFVITIAQEVDAVWARKWTLSTWIFAVNRYSYLIYAVGIVAIPSNNFQVNFLNFGD